jgi:transcriptional regulator with XRE-family HTH domain
MIEGLNLDVLGDRVRQQRKARQLSQQAVAGLMHIPQSWISDVENGKRRHVEAETLYRCCRALRCSLDYLTGLTDDPRPPRKRPRSRTAAPVA